MKVNTKAFGPIEIDEKTLVMRHNVYGIAIKDEKILREVYI